MAAWQTKTRLHMQAHDNGYPRVSTSIRPPRCFAGKVGGTGASRFFFDLRNATEEILVCHLCQLIQLVVVVHSTHLMGCLLSACFRTQRSHTRQMVQTYHQPMSG